MQQPWCSTTRSSATADAPRDASC